MDMIRKNHIVAHAVRRLGPAPAQADAGVRQVADFVVLDGAFRGHNRRRCRHSPSLPCRNRSRDCWRWFRACRFPARPPDCRRVRFHAGSENLPIWIPLPPRSRNTQPSNQIVVRAGLKIQARRSHVLEPATFKGNVIRVDDGNAAWRPAKPGLVVQFWPFGGALAASSGFASSMNMPAWSGTCPAPDGRSHVACSKRMPRMRCFPPAGPGVPSTRTSVSSAGATTLARVRSSPGRGQ